MTFHLRAAVAGFAFILSILLGLPAAQAQVTITMRQPDGVGDRIAAGRDYATEVLGDPWDMSNAADINLAESAGITFPTFNGGIFSAFTTNSDPGLILLEPGLGSTQRQGRTGKNFPIDTTLYRIFSIHMNVSVASSFQVIWYVDTQAGPVAVSAFIPTTPGWRVYTVDLATVPIVGGTVTSWSGQPATGLRLDPTTVAGSTFAIDWIRLTAVGDASTSYTATFAASDAGSNAVVNLYLDTEADWNNGYATRIATGLREDTASSFAMQLAAYAPGNYFVEGRASRDYASLMLENPWDMSDAADIQAVGNIGSVSFAGGVFSGTSTTNDPAFELNVPFNGPDYIDTSVYRTLSFQMTVSAPGQMQVIWMRTDSGAYFATPLFPTSAGSRVYTVDLGAEPNWTGLVRLLRIDPALAAGVNISVDWVSLHTGPEAVSSLPATALSVSPGVLSINSPPIVHLLQPDAMGGADYATTVRGNQWNMADAADVEATSNLAVGFPQFLRDSTEPGPRGDYLKGRNVNGDAAVFFVTGGSTPFIDANRYKNLTFRLAVEGVRDVGAGSVARVFWRRTNDAIPQSSDDIIVNEGMNTYTFDMTKIVNEPAPGTPWNGTVNYLRLDPHEFPTARDFWIDDMKIAADDEANGKFAITWLATDADDDATISLWRDTSDTGFGGTLIATGLSTRDANNVYLWDTRGVPNGTYYLYAVASDGLNTTRRYATGRLVVNNAIAGDTTKPIGALESPNAVTNASGSVNVQGWALDNVQIASVQVLIDGTPMARPATGIFRPDIRDIYPNYPDASQSGFQMSFDTTGLGPGTHSLTVAVYDTAGNRTLLGGAASGTATIGVYVPASGAFFLRNANAGGAADTVFTYGPSSSTLTPIVGDWDGDGTETVGLYDRASGAFFLKNANAGGGADIVFTFGPGGAGLTPLAGDWDGDGIDTVGLYDPATGNFFLKNTNAPGAADIVFSFGAGGGGYVPLVGDWNGDGVDTIGLYHSASGTFFLRNANSAGPADMVVGYGPPNATPVVGDWNNDGIVTVGIYVPASGAWFLRNSNTPGPADIVFSYGPANVTPLVGDWNGAAP